MAVRLIAADVQEEFAPEVPVPLAASVLVYEGFLEVLLLLAASLLPVCKCTHNVIHTMNMFTSSLPKILQKCQHEKKDSN